MSSNNNDELLKIDYQVTKVLGLDVEPEESGLLPTLNGCGDQMSCISPLLDSWMNGYDGTHPICDIGSAYGINTFSALSRKIPTIAVDIETKHLAYITEKWKNYSSQHDLDPSLLSTHLASLPTEWQDKIPDASVSSLLIAEVLHFLSGAQVELAFEGFARKLVPGGTLCITCACYQAIAHILQPPVSQLIQDQWDNTPSSSDPTKLHWPGEIDSQLMKQTQFSFRYFHFLKPDSVIELAKRNGLNLVKMSIACHPGYRKSRLTDHSNLQFTFQKL